MKKLLFIICTLLSLNCNSQSLVAYYPLNGNTNDVAGSYNGYAISSTTNPYLTDSGHIGFLFNGTSDYIDIPFGPITQDAPFIVSLWIKIFSDSSQLDPLEYSNGMPFLTFGFSAIPNYSNQLTFGLYPTPGQTNRGDLGVECRDINNITTNPGAASPFSIKKNKWYHVCVRHDAAGYIPSSFQFFVNGIQFNGNVTYGGNGNPFPLNSNISIGQIKQVINGNFFYFKGIIDDVRIYSGVSSIQNDYYLIDSLAHFFPDSSIISSIENKNKSITLEIYPNPSQSYFNIKTSELIHFEIFNSLGEIIENGICDGYKKINLENHPNGLYYLKTNSKYDIKTNKLTKI